MGNNQWNIYPMMISNKTLCECTASEAYEKFFEQQRREANWPPVGECPLKKRPFTYNNFILDYSKVPDFLPNGLWRLNIEIIQNDIKIHHSRMYAKLERIMLTA